MKTIQKTLSIHVKSLTLTSNELRDAAFFDIETTGLHWKTSHLCVIGLLYQEEQSVKLTQIFLDSPLEERNALELFFKYLQSKKRLIHYNGSSFDIPYLIQKAEFYGLEHPFASLESIDLYRKVSIYKKLLQLESYKQKDLEKAVSYPRLDQLSGKDLITYYQQYLKTADQKLFDMILLHNYDDLLGMTAILPLWNIQYYLCNPCRADIIEETDDSVRVRCRDTWELPIHFTLKIKPFAIMFHDHVLNLIVPKQFMILKHFFPNYKDYYYLPAEDTAIHKSIGQFVEKEHRCRASAATCYQKKEGFYLPVPAKFTEIPHFVSEYKSSESFCLFDQHFKNPDFCGKYMRSVFEHVIR